MKKMKLVMIGNGMAGVRTLEELLKIAPDLYDITVFGAEPHPNYNRILLSPVLAGEQTLDEIMLNDLRLVRDQRHHAASRQESGQDRPRQAAGDRRRRHRSAEYDRLLLATGSSPFILPVPGKDLRGRDHLPRHRRHQCDDRRGGHAFKHAVVIGGGLLGLEAANGLKLRGMNVTVVHLMPWLMERQLDRTAAATAAEVAGSQGPQLPAQSADRGAASRDGESGRVKAVRLQGRHANCRRTWW